ncbi:MAG TPA: MBL fold metallo-hydrolase [Burkholderiales bacterium]|nr:MBL fold metallo-hydrolase [Burkholderiales bacterium]
MTVNSTTCSLIGVTVLLAGAAMAGEMQPRQVVPGVYVVEAALGDPAPVNGGRVSNLGIIAGPEGTIVVGTGTSLAEGEALIAAAERVSGKPVVLAINPYAAPDQVLGNQAFVRRGIPVLAHEETERFLVANCTRCIERLREQVGAERLAGTEAASPTRLVTGSTTITAGGRSLELIYPGPAHQRGDLIVLDRASGVAFAGALASFGQVLDLHNGDPDGWLEALGLLAGLDVTVLVPAHGPPAPPRRVEEVRAYILALREAVDRAYDAGASLLEAAAAAELPGYRDWALYEPLHRRNIHFLYLRAEQRDMGT